MSPCRTPPHLTPEVVQAALAELRKSRTDLHRSHQVARCDLGLAMPGLRFGRATPAAGFVLSGECVCRDLVLDVLYVVWMFLTEHGADRANLAGAVRYHVRKRVIDVFRSYRADRGAPVKPKQVRNNRYGRALPDDEHRAVLGHLADEAGYSAPLPGQGYLLRRLAERCVAEFGQSVPYYLERLPSIIQTVKRVCGGGKRVNVGTRTVPEYVSWYDAYIDRPLGRRPDSTTRSLSDEDAFPQGADQVEDPDAARAFDAVERADQVEDPDAVVVDMVVGGLAGAPPDDQARALRGTVRALADRGLLPERRAVSLLADPARLDDVLCQAQVLIAGSHCA
ncbi:hypothetical protein [Actinocrispum wychmicini]|uniref:Uncharacterized protein n=1 Tax=Actinocrispum wychmicini TaxID=1213861 RepID=A0A4V2S5P8_9PSEU|nr:hypothetical protein [Actinocrispum wychmicini]TCO52910.1 hypothetical protein EV192_111104 [Actinocrispum wychmicini]